jgi:hypothetical protein
MSVPDLDCFASTLVVLGIEIAWKGNWFIQSVRER